MPAWHLGHLVTCAAKYMNSQGPYTVLVRHASVLCIHAQCISMRGSLHSQQSIFVAHPTLLGPREMDTRYPSGETVFEYSVDARNKGWLAWEARLPQGGFKPPADVPAYRWGKTATECCSSWKLCSSPTLMPPTCV